MGFKKGEGGRPKGAPNKASAVVRQLARQLFDRPYWLRTKAALRSGTLHPTIERQLLAYAYGEPKHVHEVSGPEGGPIPVREMRDYFAGDA